MARALVLGDTGGLEPRLVQGLRRAGLGHLLAVSGLHVGVLLGTGLWFGRRLGGPCRWLLPGLILGLFLSVSDPRPAIVRATAMGLIGWVALARGSRPARWNALALILLLMVLREPELLRDLGFVLTASATAGIVWCLDGQASGRAEGRSAFVRISLAAQLATLPWALPEFHLWAPAALLHNLWAIPWAAVMLVLGAGWLVLTNVWVDLARSTVGFLDLAAAPFEWLGRLPAGPWWSVPLVLTRSEAALLALCLLSLARRVVIAIVLLLLVSLLAGTVNASGSDEPELAMLDVGQGDSVLVRDGRAAILVDGGGWQSGDIGARVLVPALARLGVRRLEALVLTHPDLDHCGGLVDLAAYLPVREVWTPAGWPPSSCVSRFLSQPGLRWRPLWAGSRASVGRWDLLALHPLPGDRRPGNDRSLVLRATSAGFVALLTGDIEAAAERELTARTPAWLLRSDLLKVAHHGSRSSTSETLLAAVSPRMAWVSVGASSRYGHPHETVLDRLRAHRVLVLRTDRDGLVHLRVTADGIRLSLPGSPR